MAPGQQTAVATDRCSFCGKTHEQALAVGAGGLVGGHGSLPPGDDPAGRVPDAFICGDCAALTLDILREEPSADATAPRPTSGCSFCGKPAASVASLVVGQASAICPECVAMCAHVFDEQGVDWRKG